jgi:Tfp pilus assembly protein PilO
MKASDRAIVLGLAIVGSLAAFWFLVMAPKRAEVTKLNEEIEVVRGDLEQQELLAATAEQAKDGYGSNYHRLVVLGKAVPTDADTSSLFVQLDEIAAETGVEFNAIELSANGGGAPAPAPAASETTADDSTPPAESEGSAAVDASTPAPPTEAAAANLPLGATVGPAGLPVMPYSIELTGTFFEVSDFIASIDKLVRAGTEAAVANGRLITIDSFELSPNQTLGYPQLDASLEITTFVTPADQGLTAGATAAAPPPAAVAPTSTSTTAATP